MTNQPTPSAVELDLSPEALTPAIDHVERLLDEAEDRNEYLRLLAAGPQIRLLIASAKAGMQADANGWHNFRQLEFITNWLLERDVLSVKRTEETDGPLAAALNIIDSFEALIAAPAKPLA